MQVAEDFNKGKTSSIGEKEAERIASESLSKEYGEYFPLMTHVNTVYHDYDGSYTVRFAQLLGKDGFVEGIGCNATVLPNGKVDAMHLVGASRLSDFDESLLDGMSREYVVATIEQQIRESFKGELPEYTLSPISLLKIDGEFVVRTAAMVKVVYPDGMEIWQDGPEFMQVLPLN